MNEIFDVVVLGARLVGAASAMLLARRGLRVALVDRSRLLADTLSTHALMRPGVLQLHRRGLLNRVRAAGTPPVQRTVFTFQEAVVPIRIKPSNGVDALYAPRRSVIDPILVDAAAEAGANQQNLAPIANVATGCKRYLGTRWAILAIVSAAQFLGAFDLWVVTIALPVLQRDFASASLGDVAWILNVYTIVLATLLAPAGRIADSIGRKRSFAVGLATFGVASLGCALAPSLLVLVAWRSVQALSAAVVLPTSLGLALPAFPAHQRGTAIGIWAAVSAAAAGGGPVLGGLLVEWSWRWIFLINVPIVVVTVLAAVIVLPRDGPRIGRRFDVVGMLLVLSAMGLICGGLVQAPVWPGALTWSVLAGGLVAVAILVAHVLRHADPIVPPWLFAAPRFRVSVISLFTYYMGFSVMLLGTTLLLTQGMRLSVLDAALGIAPGPISAGIASPFSGRLTALLGARRTIIIGAVVFGLAAVWPLASADGTPSYAVSVLPSLLLWGVANALLQPTLFAGADAAPGADLALAAGVLAAARQVGSAVGVALLVGLLGVAGVGELAGFRSAWAIALVSAAATGFTARSLSQRPGVGVGLGRFNSAQPAAMPHTGPDPGTSRAELRSPTLAGASIGFACPMPVLADATDDQPE